MKRAFTMLELIFVIVIMGILAKFGVELFKQTYEGYTRSLYINELQTKSANAVQTMANRLTYRIKDSVRSTGIGSNFVQWKGFAIDSWLENGWSGIIDLDDSNATTLSSPGTAAGAGTQIFFVGSNVGNTLLQFYAVNAGTDTLASVPPNNFSGVDVYEYYQMTDGDHTITRVGTTLILDGQQLLVDDVGTDASDFLVEKLGDGIHIHLCLEKTGNPLMQGKVCKDKFVF